MAIDTQKMEARLKEELAVVTKELEGLGVHNPKADEDWIPTPEDTGETEPDPNIVADRSENWAERRGTLDALESRYNNLRHALAKVSTGTYGICEIEGTPIEEDRLEANPAARTCKKHIDQESELPL